MTVFRSIIFTSVLVGLIAGTIITCLQAFGTSRLIAEAEVYEQRAEQSEAAPGAAATEAAPEAAAATAEHDHHGHDHAAMAGHDHGEGAWEPADGMERTVFTLIANILTASGYAMLLVGLMALRGREVSWREGLVWGLAGFACVMLAPMLGLPPEVPGTPSAPLDDRQLWWIGTALATAVGIALAVFVRRPWALPLALLFVAAPHVIGAPAAPEGAEALAPEALERQFVAAAVLTSLVLWLLIGGLGAGIYRKMEAR